MRNCNEVYHKVPVAMFPFHLNLSFNFPSTYSPNARESFPTNQPLLVANFFTHVGRLTHSHIQRNREREPVHCLPMNCSKSVSQGRIRYTRCVGRCLHFCRNNAISDTTTFTPTPPTPHLHMVPHIHPAVPHVQVRLLHT